MSVKNMKFCRTRMSVFVQFHQFCFSFGASQGELFAQRPSSLCPKPPGGGSFRPTGVTGHRFVQLLSDGSSLCAVCVWWVIALCSLCLTGHRFVQFVSDGSSLCAASAWRVIALCSLCLTGHRFVLLLSDGSSLCALSVWRRCAVRPWRWGSCASDSLSLAVSVVCGDGGGAHSHHALIQPMLQSTFSPY